MSLSDLVVCHERVCYLHSRHIAFYSPDYRINFEDHLRNKADFYLSLVERWVFGRQGSGLLRKPNI